MRKIVWAFFFFSVYIWLVTSGNDQYFLEKGKEIYQSLVAWLDDATIDFQLKKDKVNKKRSRRWE